MFILFHQIEKHSLFEFIACSYHFRVNWSVLERRMMSSYSTIRSAMVTGRNWQTLLARSWVMKLHSRYVLCTLFSCRAAYGLGACCLSLECVLGVIPFSLSLANWCKVLKSTVICSLRICHVVVPAYSYSSVADKLSD